MNIILGTGPLGMAVMRELVAQEEPVTMISTSGNASVPPGVRLERADLSDIEQAKASLKHASVVFQCAQPPYQKWSKLFMPFQDHIISGAMAAGAKLVAAENMYMYGLVKGSMHEQLPYATNTKKGQVRASMSEKLLKLYQNGTMQMVMGRGADFFGPNVHNSSVGSRLFQPIAKGKACTVLGNPDKKHTYTFIVDFGKALVLLSQHEDAFGQVWHVPNADTVTTREFIDTSYRIAGFPPKIRTMGIGMLRFGGLFIPAARESIEMLYQFDEDFIVDSSKFTERFGMTATPLEAAIEQTLQSSLSI
ncbi:NAD-dependent epimerase/dehydratase family protein [Paenibacillus monticola]|uniref:NAD-dependent epimerase/dehydratase family protein n=1 Tax=Paenibacillus monticola TaxID=2666075 RepID=A0A7X2L1N7_9BACL|nr:NAD-dependent epimerase/dehydratase family protein [Paenibacillus monticola]MRN53320.1 NAD-dependent epimerase/dehydratase family protein [Paenibacillus monticola]